MAKIQKSFRLEKEVVKTLDELVSFYNNSMPEFSYKKASATDIVSLLILKEKESLRKKGYDI